jgi:dipeptidyl-peptidase-3
MSDPSDPCPFIPPSEEPIYRATFPIASFITTSIHELIGHGSGKLLSETSPGKHNFDIRNPPIDSLTGKPITAWYKHTETWTSVFGDIATSVEECRATLISYFLVDNRRLLEIFGYGKDSSPSADDSESPSQSSLHESWRSF